MPDFIKTQIELYLSGGKSIGLEKIKVLAAVYLTDDEFNTLPVFGEAGN